MGKESSAVFLDRDGVINRIHDEDLGVVGSPFRPEQFILYSDVTEAIALIHQMGKKAILVSNQPDMAKGHYSKKSFEALNRKMKSLLKGSSALDGVYYCLHHPDAVVEEYRKICECRKPKPGLLRQAAREQGIDLSTSYMIGDGISDIEAGNKAGCRTILIGRQKCDICRLLSERALRPSAVSKNLLAAVQKIKEWEE